MPEFEKDDVIVELTARPEGVARVVVIAPPNDLLSTAAEADVQYHSLTIVAEPDVLMLARRDVVPQHSP